MDVVKLWSSLLANCAIGTANVCSIPAAYFMQGTADVQVFSGYANETSSSIDSDDSNPYRGADETPEDAANGEEVVDGNGREEDEVDDLGDEGEDGECVEETPMENEEGVDDDEEGTRKRQTKIQRNRYSREEYRCTMCPYTCTTEKAFLRHLRCCESKDKKDAQLQLSCPICGKDRKGEQSLSIHMKKHKDNKHFCCDICKFKTLQLKKLIQHRRMHTGERPHLCPFCSYRSARRDNLRSHARRVHKKDNLPCDTFTPRSMLVTPTKAK